MKKLFRIPLFFLAIAACIGLLLRWHFVSPIKGFNYPYWLHAHSHIMFLGWVFNALFIAYISNFNLLSVKRYQKLFLFIQGLLCGMLVSFPLQGYGIISISLSILHTFSIGLFSYWMFRDLKSMNYSTSIWCAKISLILFIVSSLGPFALGPLMATGLGQSKWYYFAIYYYLHFQYNGVFIFGLLSLFYHLLEDKGIQLNISDARKSGILLFFSLFPSYFLSTLWANPGLPFNGIGLIGAILQLISLLYFTRSIRTIYPLKLSIQANVLMTIAFVSFVVKSLVQILSAHPQIAKLAFEVRPFVIAYIHLCVIGVVTFSLLGWYIEKGFVELRSGICLTLLISGFVGSEIFMIIGSIPTTFRLSNFQEIPLLLFSILLTLGIILFLFYNGKGRALDNTDHLRHIFNDSTPL